MTTVLMPAPKQQHFNSPNGRFLAGGKLYTYAAGTTTPKATYTDSAGLIPQTNPIILNARGEPDSPIYWDGSYKVVLKDSSGSTIYTVDNYKTDPFGIATFFTNIASSIGSTLIGIIQGGVGAVLRTLQTKVREIEVSVTDYGADPTGVANSSTAIQAAIDYVFGRGGGIVAFDTGKYKTTETITLRSNVRLVGRVGAYQPDSASGVQIVASGNNLAVLEATNVLDIGVENIRIDCSALTGTLNVGLHLNGFWLSRFRRVTVVGISPSEGYAMKFETGTGTPSFGSQHNRFELCECPDGMVRGEGKSASDQITTTVFDTFRGFQYEFQHCQVTLINCTAEAWSSGSGFYFYGSGDSTMFHCDIEGTGPVGITRGDTHTVKGAETSIWAGYSGAQRVNGTFTPLTDNLQSTVSAGNTFPDFFNRSDNVATYARGLVRADNVSGGSQSGHVEIRRLAAGVEVLQFELNNLVEVENSKSIANAATTVFSIPISSGGGVWVLTTARGTQTAAGTFMTKLDTICVNSGGTLSKTDGTALSVQTGGSTGAITYTISGTNLLVQFAHGSATPSTISFTIEIHGDGLSYSKA